MCASVFVGFSLEIKKQRRWFSFRYGFIAYFAPNFFRSYFNLSFARHHFPFKFYSPLTKLSPIRLHTCFSIQFYLQYEITGFLHDLAIRNIHNSFGVIIIMFVFSFFFFLFVFHTERVSYCIFIIHYFVVYLTMR